MRLLTAGFEVQALAGEPKFNPSISTVIC